jgi:hypothetical protein
LAVTWGNGDPHTASPPFADTEEVTLGLTSTGHVRPP